jgi:hypothetical protein
LTLAAHVGTLVPMLPLRPRCAFAPICLAGFALAASALPLVFAGAASAQVQRPLPAIERLEPAAGPPGAEVALVGRHFDDEQVVLLGETPLEVLSRVPNRWTVRIPAGASSGTIVLRTARGSVNGPRFRVTEALPPPVVASFAPAGGPPGTEVTLRGERFSPRLAENQVFLGDRPLMVRSATPTELVVVVPADASASPSGAASFRVEVVGVGRAESAAPFALTVGLAVTSIEPAIAAPGSSVTVRGTGFAARASQQQVTLGATRLRVRRASEVELVLDVPRNASTGRIAVVLRDGRRAMSGTELVVRPPPTLSAMEPAAGAPGTLVTLRGAYFGTDVRLLAARLGGSTLVVRDLADDRVVVEIPAGAADGVIEVSSAGLGPARSRASFDVLEAVTLESFEPQSGGPGSTCLLRGRGFATDLARNTVTLSGRPVEVVRATPTELEVRVPEGVPSGPLAVSVPGAGEARTSQPFVVTRAPMVSEFSPASGPAGTVLTIRGARFGTRPGLLDVRIGEATAQVQRVEDGVLEVLVPPEARTGRVRVLVRLEGWGTSATDFVVTAP